MSPEIAAVSEAHHPWWTATVDGQAAPVLRAQHAFTAVPVGPGHHVVELRFAPPFVVRAADAVSIVAWFIVPLALVTNFLRGAAPAGSGRSDGAGCR